VRKGRRPTKRRGEKKSYLYFVNKRRGNTSIKNSLTASVPFSKKKDRHQQKGGGGRKRFSVEGKGDNSTRNDLLFLLESRAGGGWEYKLAFLSGKKLLLLYKKEEENENLTGLSFWRAYIFSERGARGEGGVYPHGRGKKSVREGTRNHLT